jgi:HEPN domain-containing protein
MDTPNAILSLAEARIIESELLYEGGHYDIAYYLAGYAVELYLKARICQLLNIPDFFDFDNRKKFENEDSITKPYKVHNYAQLLILAGLHTEHVNMLNDVEFKKDWWTLKRWNEAQRYNSGKLPKDVKDFIESSKKYTAWIKQFL